MVVVSSSGYNVNIKLIEMQLPDCYHLIGSRVLGIRC